jgi:hypothetical protein
MERTLAALTAMNSALTVENEDLRAQLEAQLDGADGESSAADLKELQEEFAKRLGSADRNVAELRVRFSKKVCNAVPLSSGTKHPPCVCGPCSLPPAPPQCSFCLPESAKQGRSLLDRSR